ncbi:MAG: phosphoenolpyruvate carboxykinase (ATP), partial [Chitinophagales bacterium]
HPGKYAKMLGDKIKKHAVKVWLVNTGWSGGAFSVGSRIKLSYTRAMVAAALQGKLDEVEFIEHPIFGIAMPTSCPNVPGEILNPRNAWKDPLAYDEMAKWLASHFVKNFEKYQSGVSTDILDAAPRI